MGQNDFNYHQCVRALKKLGFHLSNKRKGNHDKLISPFDNANPPFIMIPRHRKLHCQRSILKELEVMGGNELVKKFIDRL
jgi:predicted RNA binding protein YcfA (HicA-like mRNA interferase family)